MAELGFEVTFFATDDAPVEDDQGRDEEDERPGGVQENRKAMIIYSKSPTLSPSEPSSYLSYQIYKIEGSGPDTSIGLFGKVEIPTIFQTGDTVYCRAYVGGYHSLDCNYIDFKTRRLVYTGFNNVSPLKVFIAK